MTELVTVTLRRLFAHQACASGSSAGERSVRCGDDRPYRLDFAETRPVVFRSEAFAEDLVPTHGAV